MTLYFNGGTVPLVPGDTWGQGVIMPGESYETDAGLTAPWVTDPEAAAALAALETAATPDSSPAPADAVSGPGNGSQGSVPDGGDGPELHTLDNGDVVTETGQLVGHIEPPIAATTTPGGNA